MLFTLMLMLMSLPLAGQGFEARTPHFRVLTTGAPETASSAAAALERMHSQLQALGFDSPASRMEVILFRNVAEMAPYAPPGRTTGFFQQGTDSSFLVIASSEAGDPLRTLGHELVHRVLLSRMPNHPAWLREGIAELLSNLQSASGGITLGLPIPAHLDALRRTPWLDWRLVLSGEGKSSPMFYAQSWLLVHQLVVGRPFPENLAQRIDAIEEPKQWLDRVPDPLPVEFIPVAPAVQAEARVALRPTEAWEHEHRLAELLRAMNRYRQAREVLLSLRVRYPGRPEPAESLGALDMDAFQYDKAEQWLAEAVRFGSAHAPTYYRYSLLLMIPGKSPEEAARYARRAVELDSSQPLHWLADAQARMQLSDWEAARNSLAQLRERARDPVLQEQVRIELAEIERRREQSMRPPPAPDPPAKVVVSEIKPPPPQEIPAPSHAPRTSRVGAQRQPGALLFWGYVRAVECTAQGKILTVWSPRFTVRVLERAGRPAKLRSPPRNLKQIPCSLKNVEVNVVYRPFANFGPLNGDLLEVYF